MSSVSIELLAKVYEYRRLRYESGESPFDEEGNYIPARQERLRPENFGWSEIGSGCYGTAIRISEGYVLKLGHSYDGSATFIQKCAQWYEKFGAPPTCGPKVFHFEYEELGSPATSCIHSDSCECEVNTPKRRWFAIMEWVTPYSDNSFGYNEDGPRGTLRRAVQDFMGPSFGINDLHSGNWGKTRDGRTVAFDPSSISLDYDTIEECLDHIPDRVVPHRAADECEGQLSFNFPEYVPEGDAKVKAEFQGEILKRAEKARKEADALFALLREQGFEHAFDVPAKASTDLDLAGGARHLNAALAAADRALMVVRPASVPF